MKKDLRDLLIVGACGFVIGGGLVYLYWIDQIAAGQAAMENPCSDTIRVAIYNEDSTLCNNVTLVVDEDASEQALMIHHKHGIFYAYAYRGCRFVVDKNLRLHNEN